MIEFETRVGAYGVIIEGGRILLAHFNAFGESNWTLPGGGLELGEDGEAAAVREIREETGFRVVLDGLLGIDSVQIPADARIDGRARHLHLLRLFYRAQIVGGQLTPEAGGSTDDAEWFRLKDVLDLERVHLVDIGVRLWEKAVVEAEDVRRPRERSTSLTWLGLRGRVVY